MFQNINESTIENIDYKDSKKENKKIELFTNVFAIKNIPIYIIAKTGSDISSTIGGLAKEIIFYDKPEDITEKFKEILK